MNTNKQILATLLLFVGITTAIFAQQTITGESRGINVSFTIQKDTVEITMSAAVTGWIAIGIDPTNKMKDADFKIAYIKDGMVFIRDDFGNSPIAHREDVELGGTSDTHKIIVAASDRDSFTAKHKVVGSFNITLP